MPALPKSLLRRATLAALCLLLGACATAPPPPTSASGPSRGLGTPPAPNPGLKRALIERATREWDFFGRQTVVYRGGEESIPHVGAWEDDDPRYSARVAMYWRAVGKPRLSGMDCKEPWSAAFISWVMRSAGVSESQFPSSEAHAEYLAALVEAAPFGGRWFVPRRIGDYSPAPGDLICAWRGFTRPVMPSGQVSAAGLRGVKAHCDLVVAKNGRTLEAIGGNVRNSVSRSTLELDGQGHLQAVPRRPWFVVMQNRL